MRIRVLWKNVALTVCGLGFFSIFLSLLTVKNINAPKFLGIALGVLVSLGFSIRAFRTSIVIRDGQFVLRRIAPTKRVNVNDIRSVEVGEEATPITRYYIVFNLKNGAKVKMKDVFLWGVNRRARERAEEWARRLTSILDQ